MSMHHTLEEKQEILRLHEAGVSVVELITHFHVIGHIKELSVRLPLSLATDVSQISIGQQKSFLSPVIDIFNGEILNYNIADRADLEQINKMLNDLFAITDKLAKENQIILHSDQG